MHTCQGLITGLGPGSRRDFRAISPITQPQDSPGAAPAHTPGRAEPPTQPPGRSRLLTPGGLGRPSPRGQAKLPPTSAALARRFTLHWPGPLLCPESWEGDLSLLGAPPSLAILNLLTPPGQRPMRRRLAPPHCACAICHLDVWSHSSRSPGGGKRCKRVCGARGGRCWQSLGASLARPTEARTSPGFARCDPTAPGPLARPPPWTRASASLAIARAQLVFKQLR